MMRKNSMKYIALALVLALMAGTAACSQPDPAAPENPASEAPDTEGSTAPEIAPEGQAADGEYRDKIVIQISADVENLHPSHVVGYLTTTVANQLYTSLVKYDMEGNVVPWLADSVELSDDGKKYTVTIPEDAKFSDGSPLTTREIKYIYDLTMDESTASVKRSNLVNSIENISIIDDRTMEFNLFEPMYLFPDYCLMLHIPEPESIEEFGDSYNQHVVGSGLYKLSEWVPGEKLVLEANEHYHQGTAATKYVEFKIIPDPMVAQIELEEGSVDLLMDVQQTDLPRYEELDNIRLIKTAPLSNFFLMYNMALSPFNDVTVRKALVHAINRQQIADIIVGELGTLSDGWLPVSIGAYMAGPEEALKYDPELTAAMLAEAGYADTDGDGFLDKDGSRLSFEINYRDRQPEAQVVEAIQNAFKESGIDATLSVLESAQYTSLLREKDKLKIYTQGASQDYYDPLGFIDFMFGTGPWALNNFDNERVVEICNETKVISDKSRRTELFTEAQNIMFEEMPAIPLYSLYSLAGINAKMENFEFNSTKALELRDVRIRK